MPEAREHLTAYLPARQDTPSPVVFALRDQVDDAVRRIHDVLDEYDTPLESIIIGRLEHEVALRFLERQQRDDPAYYRHLNGEPLPPEWPRSTRPVSFPETPRTP